MSESPLILVCDHRGEGLSESVRPLAAVGFRIHWAGNLGQTRERIEALQPDILVIDPLSQGGVVELEVIERVRRERCLPVLLIAEPRDPQTAIQAAQVLESGPWDLVHRDAPLEEFVMRIDRLADERSGLAEIDDLRYHADHDDRTGLLRPRPFQARLHEHFSAAHRHRFDLALVLVDLDEFGLINKDFDHMVGDLVIGRVGMVVRDSLRAEDVGGRLGGDEFAVVLPYTRKVDAARVVNRMRDEILGLSGTTEGVRGELRVSASLGFETFDGSDLESVEELRRHSEVALRHAKSMGGNRGIFYRSLQQETGDTGEPGGSAYQDRA